MSDYSYNPLKIYAWHGGQGQTYPEYLAHQQHAKMIADSVRETGAETSRKISGLSSGLEESTYAISEGVQQSVSEMSAHLEEHLQDLLAAQVDGNAILEKELPRVSDTLGYINMGLRQVNQTIEAGFHEVAAQLNDITGILDDLLSATKTPEETWANEQYELASLLFRNKKFRDSLDCINMAIDGHKDNIGYKFNVNYYILRGLIYLGSMENVDLSIVNLEKSKRQFELAVNYSLERGNPAVDQAIQRAKGEAYSLLGWSSYCLGRGKDAVSAYRSALQISPKNPKYWFYLSKVLFSIGDNASAQDALYRSLRLDARYEYMANADEDCQRFPNVVDQVVKKYREELLVRKVELEKTIKIFLSGDVRKILLETIIEGKASTDLATSIISENLDVTNQDLSGLLSVIGDFETALTALRGVADGSKRAIEEKIQGLEQDRSQRGSAAVSDGEFHRDAAKFNKEKSLKELDRRVQDIVEPRVKRVLMWTWITPIALIFLLEAAVGVSGESEMPGGVELFFSLLFAIPIQAFGMSVIFGPIAWVVSRVYEQSATENAKRLVENQIRNEFELATNSAAAKSKEGASAARKYGMEQTLALEKDLVLLSRVLDG